MTAHLKSTGVMAATDARVTAHCWVRFDMSDHSKDNDYNVSSVTDVDQGRTTVNFGTNAAGTADYAVTWPTKDNNWGASGNDGWLGNYNTGSVRVNMWSGTAYMDSNNVSVIVFGDFT